MKLTTTLGALFIASTVFSPGLAFASSGTWSLYMNGGPSPHGLGCYTTCSANYSYCGCADGDGPSPTGPSANTITLAGGTVQTLSQTDYINYWNGSGWTQNTLRSNVMSLFHPWNSSDETMSLLVDQSNEVILSWHGCGLFGCAWTGHGFPALSGAEQVAGSSGNPYAAASNGNVYYFNGSSWVSTGAANVISLTVDVEDSNHYPWVAVSDCNNPVWYYNGSWQNAHAPAGICPVQIAVMNNSVWALDGQGGLYEWEHTTTSWVKHNADGGAPSTGMFIGELTVQPSAGYVPYSVYVVTSSEDLYVPEQTWVWTCDTCTG